MSKKEFNTTNVGDTIILLRMNDKFSRVPMGTIGTIKRIVRDPFEKGHHIVDVEWEGESSNLNLLTSEDLWMKVDDLEKMNEEVEKVVKPSSQVVKSICDAKKFCSAQGPITFGQLKTIVNSAKSKRLWSHIGEGGFKAFIRLMPWFIPQIAVAGFIGSGLRAANKLFAPTLKETSSYKTWWARTINNIFKVAEGDINPEDPLSKIFFISDGLMNLMNEENKLKFAFHIAEIADSMPDDQPVPEFFVENELRSWINQRFLLDPPLQPKTLTSFDDVDIESLTNTEDDEEKINEENSAFDRFDKMSPILSPYTKVIYDFLLKLRKSGIVNMFESTPFMYSGRDYIENYVRFKNIEFDGDREQEYEELLDAADEARNAMVGLTIEYLESKGEEPTIEKMNRSIRILTQQLFSYYVARFNS
jgi:hypothetical protein